MAIHASWVNGNAVRPEWVHDNLQNVEGTRWDGTAGGVPWSDVNGLPRGWGTTFRGRRAFTGGLGGTTTGPFDPGNPFQYSQKGYWFHFAVPTPVLVADRRARLLRVFVMWGSGAGVEPWAVHVYDGAVFVDAFPVAGGAGADHATEFADGVTRFGLASPHEVVYGIGITVAVAFTQDGDITFNAAGADFDV